MIYGQKAREEQRQLEAIYGYNYYQGDVGSWGWGMGGEETTSWIFDIPVGRNRDLPGWIEPYIPPLYPTEEFPEVRPQPRPEPPEPVDIESGRVEVSLPTQAPVFIPEPTPAPVPTPSRTEPASVRIPLPGPIAEPIPYLPAPEPVIVQRAPELPKPDPVVGDDEMAIDWGDIFTTSVPQIIEGFWGGGSAPAPTYTPVPGIQPSYAAMTATGVPKCKRRRRRRLLTESDFNDLMRIATLPNKQNVAVALAKAVGRR